MAFQSVPNTVQLRAIFKQDLAPAIWSLNFLKPGGYSQGDLDALAASVNAEIEEEIDVLINNHTTYEGVGVRGLSEEFDMIATSNPSAPIVGTLAAVQSAGVAKAFKLGTGLTGRSARGRFYWCGLGGEQLASATTVNSDFINDVITLIDSIKTIAESLGFIMVIVSRWSNGVKRVVGLTTPVTQITVSNNTLDSMRKRLD